MADGIGITVTEHILIRQKEQPEATGAFSRLLAELTVAAKIISREVNKAGLVEVLGATGRFNVQGERVRKLDLFADDVIVSRMERCGQLCAMASEENADIIDIPLKYPRGNYALLFDPLDGSSNIDANVSIGTIFSIQRKVSKGEDACPEDLIQQGRRQVAAGYFVYGSSTMMVYTTGKGVFGFTLDPSVGELLLSHESIRIPERGKSYSVNEGNYAFWDEGVRRYIDSLKRSPLEGGRVYSARYIGSLVADFHRTLLYGGIFMYPADSKDPKKPSGKLRLLYECAPLAFVCEQAGGLASDGHGPILDIDAQELHQRAPLFIGSREDVLTAERYVRGEL
ncbi:MAG: class 1 fructose-bisphosphatase [Pseudomonadota bacterium]